MIIGLIKLRISDFKTANCKNYVSRKYKRAPGEPMHRILFFIAPEMSLCILSRHIGTGTKIRRAYTSYGD